MDLPTWKWKKNSHLYNFTFRIIIRLQGCKVPQEFIVFATTDCSCWNLQLPFHSLLWFWFCFKSNVNSLNLIKIKVKTKAGCVQFGTFIHSKLFNWTVHYTSRKRQHFKLSLLVAFRKNFTLQLPKSFK